MVKVPTRAELWGLSAIVLVGAFIVAPGFFSIDEAIYYLGARAIAEHGALGIGDNGYAQFHSEALKIRLLVEGPQGLTPQYPAGSSLLASPLLPIMGTRAFILLNALASTLTFFTVWRICLHHFHSKAIARIALALLVLGSFWVEYAVGIWPHALSAFFAVQAYWFALRHLGPDQKGYRYAILSGLFAGAGMLFRLDAIVVVPAVGLILVMFAHRFVRSGLWFGVAVLPSLGLASALNHLKFGTPNPFSYGLSRGNTDLFVHGPLVAAIFVAFFVLLLWRKFEWKISRRGATASVLAAVIALLVIPATGAWLIRFWDGFLALVVDMRTVEDHRPGVQPGPGGTLVFWELIKKSLGQSMPWIGLTAVLLTGGVQKGERRFIAAPLIFIATMTLPFILLSWHGGGSGNMRYFLPAVPMLCILCAKLLYDLWRSVPNALIFAGAGLGAAILLGAGWIWLHPSGHAGVQQILSTYILLATALAAIAAGASWRSQQAARELTLALFSIGFVISMTSASADFIATEERRSYSHRINLAAAGLPAKSLFVAYPEWAAASIPGNGSILADRDPRTKEIDPWLIFAALDAGYRVFIASHEFYANRDVPPGVEAIPTRHRYPSGHILELRRQAAQVPVSGPGD